MSSFVDQTIELRASGFLDLALPPQYGGPGLTLAEIGAWATGSSTCV